MREYSPEELDVMAEAYFLVQDKVPHQQPSTEATLRLVNEIGLDVARGIHDEDALAQAALDRTCNDNAI